MVFHKSSIASFRVSMILLLSLDFWLPSHHLRGQCFLIPRTYFGYVWRIYPVPFARKQSAGHAWLLKPMGWLPWSVMSTSGFLWDQMRCHGVRTAVLGGPAFSMLCCAHVPQQALCLFFTCACSSPWPLWVSVGQCKAGFLECVLSLEAPGWGR
jgi:hypothetical protein